MIFFLKQTVNRFLNISIICYSFSRNHCVLCCKRLNGFWAICFKCRSTFCLLKSVFHDHLKPPKKKDPFDGKGSLKANLGCFLLSVVNQNLLFPQFRNNRGKVIKPLQYQSTVASGTVARVEPNIKWFGEYYPLLLFALQNVCSVEKRRLFRYLKGRGVTCLELLRGKKEMRSAYSGKSPKIVVVGFISTDTLYLYLFHK